MDGITDGITGSCAVGYGSGDPVTVSKVFVDFAKENANLRLKYGYVDGKVIKLETIKELAALPSRQVLLTRLVSCLNSPITGFVSTCSGVINKFVYALSEISKKKQA
jgi:large subunit ribosomal protein L10